LNDGSSKYMVLDGANRITAFKQMGIPHISVQVIGSDEPGVNLQNWNHVIWELNPIQFLRGIRKIPGQSMKLISERIDSPGLKSSQNLVIIKSCRGRTYGIQSELTDLSSKIDILNAVIDSYWDRGRFDRTNQIDIHSISKIYPSLSGLVIFPKFTIKTLLTLAGKGFLLPSGITRFSITPRALHLNYSLEELSAEKSLEDKNLFLHQFIQRRINQKGVRYYPESTYLFDE
jgi:hypothetical protein